MVYNVEHVELDDSGEYTCQCYMPSTEMFMERILKLVVGDKIEELAYESDSTILVECPLFNDEYDLSQSNVIWRKLNGVGSFFQIATKLLFKYIN